jgi:hypothetical protein
MIRRPVMVYVRFPLPEPAITLGEELFVDLEVEVVASDRNGVVSGRSERHLSRRLEHRTQAKHNRSLSSSTSSSIVLTNTFCVELAEPLGNETIEGPNKGIVTRPCRTGQQVAHGS